MAWIVVAAWGSVVLLAAVLLGFCVYELQWKRARLVRDLGVLRSDVERLSDLSAQLGGAVQQRLANPGI